MRPIDYSTLPSHMREGMELWIEHGIDGGDFMTAVLCNDLMGAVGRADSMNINRLKDYALFLYNEAPPECYGSRENVKAWSKKGGRLGHSKSEAA